MWTIDRWAQRETKRGTMKKGKRARARERERERERGLVDIREKRECKVERKAPVTDSREEREGRGRYEIRTTIMDLTRAT